jgi:MFS family permease
MLINIINYFIEFFVITSTTPKQIKDSVPTTDITKKRESIWREIFKSPKKRAVILFFAIDMFIFNISLSIYGAGLRDQYNLTYEQMAFIAIWLSISTMIFQIPGGHLADKIGKKNSLIVSELFGLAYFFVLILTFILWYLGFHMLLIPLLSIANILFGLNITTFIPSAQMIITDFDETRKAESYGIANFLKGIGFMPTGIIGGFLIESISYIAPFIITFIGIIFLIIYLRKYFESN